MTSSSKGLVIRNTGNTYLVRDVDGNEFISKAKGNLRLKGIRSTSPVVVSGNRTVIHNNARSIFDARIWECFERLDALRTI